MTSESSLAPTLQDLVLGLTAVQLPAGQSRLVGTAAPSDLGEVGYLQSGFRYALALTHHSHDAEDLTQQGFLRVYRKYGGVPSLPLLFTTIRNIFYDKVQRDARLRMISLEEFSGEEESGETQLTDLENIPNLSRVEVERLLAGLRPQEREVLFLHYIYGYTAAEVGDLTGQPRNTVLSLLLRGRKKLLAALKGGKHE